jgi:uncharacterized membrane protein YtjA (UPF0391 family)
MLKWAVFFAVLAALAGVLGFSGLAGAAAGVAKLLFYAALVLFLLLFVFGFTLYWKIGRPLRRIWKDRIAHADQRQHRR